MEFAESESSKLSSNFKGQGTIEYLVILAIVVVISLVVVGLLMTQTQSSVNVSKTSSKIGGLTQSIGVIESLVSPTDQNFVVKLLNNSGSIITVSNVKVGDKNVNFSEDLAQGGAKLFKVNTGDVCELGKIVSEDVVVTYVTSEGLTKTEVVPGSVMFDCTPFNIAQANLANQCPSCGSTCSGGSQSLSASSVSVAAGCYTVNDLNVIDSDLVAGNIVSGATIFGIEGSAETGGGEPGFGFISYANPSYTYNEDGTVTDSANGLVWQAINYGSEVSITWQQAMDYCNNNTPELPGTGWRVPNALELELLYDHSNGRFYLEFDGPVYSFWSSTTARPSSSGFAYVLYSLDGTISLGSKTLDGYLEVKCVRSAN